MNGRRRAPRKRGVMHFVLLGLSTGLLGLVALVAALVIGVPAVTGSTPMTVLTSSMEPTYPPGTLIIVSPIEAEQVRIGDAVTFQRESGRAELVTHRVVAISNTDGGISFSTKGDNNGSVDEAPVIPVQLRGKVAYSLPWIGYINTAVSGDNRAWIVPVVATVLFLYAGFMFASGIAGRLRTRGRHP